MKLLLDAKHLTSTDISDLWVLSPVNPLALVGLGGTTDDEIWNYALDQGFVIIPKDEDFHQSVLVSGPPPKVIWVRLGNCTTDDIEQAIHRGHDLITDFLKDETASFLTLQ